MKQCRALNTVHFYKAQLHLLPKNIAYKVFIFLSNIIIHRINITTNGNLRFDPFLSPCEKSSKTYDDLSKLTRNFVVPWNMTYSKKLKIGLIP